MMNPEDGGGVYPSAEDMTRGLSMREYYAAHAPAVPDWFEHVPLTRESLPKPPSVEQFSSMQRPYPSEVSDRELALGWLSDPCFDLDIPASDDWQRRAKEYWHANKQWERDNQMQRLTQWAFAWADAMIAQSQSE